MLAFQLREEVPLSQVTPSSPGNESSGLHGPPVDPAGREAGFSLAQFDPLPVALPHATILDPPEENVPAQTCTSRLLIEEEVLS